jgi:hypothetical protein
MRALRHRLAVRGYTPRIAMADVEASGPVADLIRQLNRFGPAAPAGLVFLSQPLATGNVITPEVAIAAVTIFQRRATDAWNQFHDQGSAAAIDAANAAFADPVSFVTARLSEVTTAVAGFADASGLPGPQGSLAGDSSHALLIVAGIGLALWWLMRSP